MRRQTLLKRALILPVVVGALSVTSFSPGEEAPLLRLVPPEPEDEPVAEVDADFPLGARRGPARPSALEARCSPSRPVCVHGGSPSLIEQTLAALERAYDKVVLVLRMPPPLPDADPAGPGLDLYLTDSADSLEVGADLNLTKRDSTSAYCLVGSAALTPSDPTRCVVEAALVRIEAAETPALRRAFATYASWLLEGPDSSSIAAVDRAQANPHLGLIARDREPLSDAGALFLAHLERAYGSGLPGEGALALFTQSRSDEPSEDLEWHNEPDSFDVLRVMTNEDTAKLADLALDFAIARLFLGDRADGSHVPGFPWLGRFGRVRFDWSVSFASLPRNLAAARPLEPFGSAYVWLDVRNAPANAPLAASFSFEAPVRFRFSIVAVDAAGRELTRFDVPFFGAGGQVERTFKKPPDAVGLVFVATNLGAVSEEYPFDPDHAPFEPHGYELYIAPL